MNTKMNGTSLGRSDILQRTRASQARLIAVRVLRRVARFSWLHLGRRTRCYALRKRPSEDTYAPSCVELG